MEFAELIKKRYSVRAYKADPVEEDKLQHLLEAARLAPTAANRQPFRLIVVETAKHQAELRRVYDWEWFTQAPLVIFACGLPAEAWTRTEDGLNFSLIDVAIAIDHLTLAAANVGLGTCWVASFDLEAARQLLNLPVGVRPVVATPVGYPADQPVTKERQPLTKLVRYGRW